MVANASESYDNHAPLVDLLYLLLLDHSMHCSRYIFCQIDNGYYIYKGFLVSYHLYLITVFKPCDALLHCKSAIKYQFFFLSFKNKLELYWCIVVFFIWQLISCYYSSPCYIIHSCHSYHQTVL